MNFWLYILVLFLLLRAGPASAETGSAVVWDLRLAPAVRQPAGAEEACRANPYALYRRGCPEALNVGLERSGSERLSTLDRLLLFIDQHKSLTLDTNLNSSAKLKFSMGLVNVYEQRAEARITLRIRF